jgi:hypothetical protein
MKIFHNILPQSIGLPFLLKRKKNVSTTRV